MNCPFGKPEIYRIAAGHSWQHGEIYDPGDTLNHPFREASRNLRFQAEKAINFSIFWPNEMYRWLVRFVIPLELAYEMGDHTPGLRDAMLALDVAPVAAKLLYKKRPVPLTTDTRRLRVTARKTCPNKYDT